jgi:hypothetical protein
VSRQGHQGCAGGEVKNGRGGAKSDQSAAPINFGTIASAFDAKDVAVRWHRLWPERAGAVFITSVRGPAIGAARRDSNTPDAY